MPLTQTSAIAADRFMNQVGQDASKRTRRVDCLRDATNGPLPITLVALPFAVHLQDAGNRYRLYRNDKGIPWHIFLDDLAPKREDGFSDYTDPSVFPALWKQPRGCK